ncbi:MAG: hypothetical protein ACXAE3_16275 [Candidatus Kariarchaeaceae archaeon]
MEESRLSLWFFFLQFVLLILLFLHVTAGHWVFLPSIIHPMLRGQAWFYLTLISFTASTFALMEVRS